MKYTFAALAATAVSANAAILAVDSVTTTTAASSGTSVNKVIDGVLAATTADFAAGTYTTLTEANKGDLVSNDAYGFNGGGSGNQYLSDNINGTFTFTFAGTVNVDKILIWNYSQNAARALQGVNDVEVSTDGGTTWTATSDVWPLAAAGLSGFEAQAFNVTGGTGINAIRFNAVAGTNSGGAGGFDEVAFSGSVVAVPEPSSTALLGLGGLALILRRRK